MKFILSALIVVLMASSALAATYKVSKTDGTADFTSIAALDAFIDAGSIACGDTVQIDECETHTNQNDILTIRSQINCTSASPVTFTTYQSTACTALPTWAITQDMTLSWSVSSGSIYTASVDSETALNRVYDRIPLVLYEDGVKLVGIPWTTNLATTSALMSAGTFTFDDTGWQTGNIYVWAFDGANPSTHTYTYGSRNCVICCNKDEFLANRADSCGGIVLDGLWASKTNRTAFVFGEASAITPEYQSHDVKFRNIKCTEGIGCIVASGDSAEITDSESDDNAGSQVLWGANSGSIPSFAFQAAPNFVADDISCANGKQGTCLEINFGSSNGTATDITSTNGAGSCSQVYYDSNDNVIERINCRTSVGASGGFGFIFSGATTLGSDGNIVRNSYFEGNAQTCFRFQADSTNNIVENITCKSPTAGWSWAAIVSYQTANNNTVRNSILQSQQVTTDTFIDDEDGNENFNYNIYYQPAGTWSSDVAGVAYSSFATHKAGTSQDANSLNSNPLLYDYYKLPAGSIAIDGGQSITGQIGNTDIDGHPRIVDLLDIGAYEYQIPFAGYGTLGDGPVKLNRFRGRIRVQ